MNGDTLMYKLPRQTSVERRGVFKPVQKLLGLKGFIVSSFLKDEIYRFNESNLEPAIFHGKSEPVLIVKEKYLLSASDFLVGLRKRKISKAIFSRIKEVKCSISPIDAYADLCKLYPDAFVYLISSPMFGTWIGASPEALLLVENGEGSTVSLAGTKKRDDHSPWGDKEKEEQQIVTTYLTEKLNKLDFLNSVKVKEREELIAGPVKHLATEFTFNVPLGKELEIADILHPTPAVSGWPQQEAMNLISDHEDHERRLYSGIVGLIEKDSTNLFVNLRCGELREKSAILYVGGGFTVDSIPEEEWEETELKSETLTNVLQNT